MHLRQISGFGVILAVAFLVSRTSAGDLPSSLAGNIDPKKDADKKLKEARPVLEGEEDGDHVEFHRRLATEGEKTLEEINRLLEEVQKNLGDKRTDAPIQAKQKAAVERMEQLIKELGKGCSRCSSASSGKGDPKSQAAKDPRQSQKEKQKAEDEKKSEAQKARERQKMQARQQKPENGAKEKNDGKAENDRTADAKPQDAKTGRLDNQLRESARWGLLPPKFADEVLFSSGKEAPPEYREIISRYYKRITDTYVKSRK